MKRLHLWLFALILFAAFAFRLSGLGSQSLWHDEAWSIMSAYHPLAWGAQGTDPNAPPVFYLSLGGWMQFVGDSVWALRYWSLIFGVVLTAVVGWLARRWYGERAGLLAALFVAFNPMLWTFSQEIRAYIVMPLGAVLLLFLMERILQTGSRRAWGYLAAVEWLTLYSQNLAVPIVAWLNVTMIAALILRREWRKLRNWMIVQAAIGLLYLPWLLTQKPTGTPLNTTPPINPELVWNIWQSYFSGIRTMISADSGLILLCAVLIIPVLVGLIAALTLRRNLRTVLLLSQVMLIPIFETAIIYAAHIDFHPRYYIVSVPTTLMLVAAGLSGVNIRRLHIARRTLQVATALVIIVIGVHVWRLVDSTPVYRHDDFRAIAERYKRDLTAEDAIIIPYGYEPTLNYYIQKMNIPARVIALPLYSPSQTIIDTLARELPQVRRAEFLTWYQLPADVRGAYPCLLGGIGTKDSSLTVQGMQTDRYAEFRVITLDEMPLHTDLDFGVINLYDTYKISGVDGVCLIHRWLLRKQTSEPLRLSAKILISPLTEAAVQDIELLDDKQLTTNHWDTGNPIDTFTWLAMPQTVGQVVAKVYSLAAPNGLDGTVCINAPGETCKPRYVSRRPYLGTIRPAPPSQIQFREGDTVVNEGLAIRRQYPVHPLAQGECLFLRTELVQLNPDLRIGYVATFSDGYYVVLPLDATASRPRIHFFAERFCAALDANGSIKVHLAVLNAENKPVKNVLFLGEIIISPVVRNIKPIAISQPESIPLTFLSLATLVKVDLPPKIQAGQAFDATLIWQTEYQKEANVRVFVQVLDDQGRLIAQHDGVPVNGTRPANNWEAGEVLTDRHRLEWSRSDYKGAGTLIVGFYDPDTFLRAITAEGKDNISIPITIE